MNYALGYSKAEKQVLNSWAEWLDSIDWTAFCTFTTHYRLSKDSARKKMEKMSAYLLDKYSNSFRIFWVAEPHSDKSDFHVHALIKIDASEVSQKELLTEAWRKVSYPSGNVKHNIIDVQNYEPTRGAQYYVAKHIQKVNIDYGMY